MIGRIKDRASDGVASRCNFFFPVLSGDEFVSTQPGGFLALHLFVLCAVSQQTHVLQLRGNVLLPYLARPALE